VDGVDNRYFCDISFFFVFLIHKMSVNDRQNRFRRKKIGDLLFVPHSLYIIFMCFHTKSEHKGLTHFYYI